MKIMPRSRKGQFTLLVAVLVLFVLVGGVLAGRYARSTEKRVFEEQAARQQKTLAINISAGIAAEIESLKQKLEIMAQLSEIKSDNPAVCNAKLESIRDKEANKLGNLGRINKDGYFYCSVNKAIIGKKGSDLGPYVNEIFQDPEHKAVMSRSIVVPGAPSRAIAIHVPVRNDKGEFIGTLGGAIYLKDLQDQYLSNFELSGSSFAVLTDDNKDILFHPRQDFIGKSFRDPAILDYFSKDYAAIVAKLDEALAGSTVTLKYMAGGERRIGSFHSAEVFPGHRWGVYVAQPEISVTATSDDLAIRRALFATLAIFATVVAVSGAIGVAFIVRFILQPVESVAAAAAAIGKGDLDQRVKYRGNDEIGQLGRAFNDMAKKLRESYANLEEQVVAKTSELAKVIKSTETQNANLENTKRAVLNILEDLSEEKAATEAAKAKDEAILASIGDGVFAVDTEGTVILFNQAAEEITGYKAGEVIGKSFSTTLRFETEGTGEKHDEFITKALSGSINKMPNNTVIIHKNGSSIPVEDSAAPVRDANDTIIGAIIVFRDVTEERELDKAKEEFVSIASHELRTPATAVKNFIGLLREGYAGKLTKEQTEYVEYAYESNERQLQIINNLLYVARSDAGRIVLNRRPTDIKKLIEDIINEQQAAIDSRKQKLKLDLGKKPVMSNIDMEYFRMGLTNFISNASKYTPEKGSLSVLLDANKDSIIIAVSDTGVGIAKQDLPKLFGKFSRIDNPLSAKVGGNGLGLYLTKQIIDLHGGRIEVKSMPGKGSTFTIILPTEGHNG